MGLTMPTVWRYGSPVAMPIFAVNAFNTLIHTIAAQSKLSWSIFELFKAKFNGVYPSSSCESWAISNLHSAMERASLHVSIFMLSI